MSKKKNKDGSVGVPSCAITERELRSMMKQKIKACSSELEWSRSVGITPQVVSAFRRKVQGPGLRLPEVLGYRPQLVFLPLKEPLIQTPNPPRRLTSKPTSKVDHTKEPIEKTIAKTEKKSKKAKKKKKK
jgi:hypothetical protein